jgi:hypothetical protein
MTIGFSALPAGTDMIASWTDLNCPLPSWATVMLIGEGEGTGREWANPL